MRINKTFLYNIKESVQICAHDITQIIDFIRLLNKFDYLTEAQSSKQYHC